MTTETQETQTAAPQTAAPQTAAAQAAPAPQVTIQTEFQFEATGNAGLDYALRYLGKQGIGPDHPAVAAAQQGNWSAMDVLAAERKLDADVLTLGKAGFADLQAKQAAAATGFQAELNNVAKQAGLQDWNAVKEFAKTNATPEELQAVNSVLAKGDAAAKLLAQALVQRAASVPINRDGAAATKASASAIPATAQAVTQAKYMESLAALQRTHGLRYSQTKEFQTLVQNRIAAKMRGTN